jgi:predicted transcriptional regulator
MSKLLGARAENQIIIQILDACKQKPVTKLEIMYSCSLSHARCTEFLMKMVKVGLLDYYEETKKYKVTPAGLRLLRVTE